MSDGLEVHPVALVTVKTYFPVASPLMVLLVPVPVVVGIPGPSILVNVQVPVAGKFVNTTLPVAEVHVG